MSARSSRTRERVLRPLLAANTVLFVCLTLFAYFLFDLSFYTGQETLTETATQHLMERECKIAADYLRARLPEFKYLQYNKVQGQPFIVAEIVEAAKAVL